MANPDRNRRLWSLGLFALPLIAVKLAATLFGGGAPHPAQASSAMPAPAITDPSAGGAISADARIEWSPRQRAAGEYVRQLAAKPFGPTPLLYTPKPKADPPAPVVEPVVEAPVITLPSLRAVMTTSSGNKALINNKFYNVGEAVSGTPWTVQVINIDDRSVTLADSDGNNVTIAVQTPG